MTARLPWNEFAVGIEGDDCDGGARGHGMPCPYWQIQSGVAAVEFMERML